MAAQRLKHLLGRAVVVLVASAVGILLLMRLGASHVAAQGDAAAQPAKTESRVLRFGHALHKGQGVAIEDCASCHGIKGSMIEPVTRGKNHQPCNNAACHASEYMSREPRICVVCHDTSEPWVKQQARIRALSASEFGGEISHKTHQSDKARKGGVKCESCHGNVFERGNKPEAHAVCGSCHQGDLSPSMADCGSCHKLGYQAQRLKSASRYSVRARFDHRDHDRDPRSKAKASPDCNTCHVGVENAATLAELPRPTMQSCDSCHDGEHAFKTTGFGCVKCHGDAN